MCWFVASCYLILEANICTIILRINVVRCLSFMYLAEVFFGDIIYVLCKIKFLLLLKSFYPSSLSGRKNSLQATPLQHGWPAQLQKNSVREEETEHCSSISVELSGIYIISWGRQQEGVEIIFFVGAASPLLAIELLFPTIFTARFYTRDYINELLGTWKCFFWHVIMIE